MTNKIHYYKSIDSTNRVLKDMAQAGTPEGTVVLTSHQTAGKGRLGRHFFSPSNCGLYLSILYKPDLSNSPMDPLSLTMQAAVSVFQSIQSVCQISPGIKWVNDLYYHDKKIAGILAEGISKNNQLSAIILGVGINLWTPIEGYPDDIQAIAGSIYGSNEPDEEIFHHLANTLIQNLFPLKTSEQAIKIYRENSIVLGKEVTLSKYDTSITGIVSGFTEKGGLILTTENHTEEIFHSGEITLRLT